jgi:hypothetical protein
MMSGVAQVIGMKPIFKSVFSGLPLACASASSAPNGKNVESTALAVEAPTARRKRRRTASTGNSARIAAVSSTRRFSVS